MRAYKIVRDDYCDFYTGTVKYEIGTTLIHPNPDTTSNKSCGRGYHVSSKPYLALKHNRPGRLLEVRIKKENILGSDATKMRVSELEVIRELDKNMVFGKNWKNVVKKIKRASNRDAYFTATKPCPQELLNEVIKRHKPFTKAKLTTETKAFKSWDSARAEARTVAGAEAWAAAGDGDSAMAEAWTGDSAMAEAWAAAGDAAWGAALNAAWDAVWSATGATARTAARIAAWDAARIAAWAAARAVARAAAWEVISDIFKYPNPYEPIMDIWLSGYFVYLDGTRLIAAYVENGK